MVSVSFKGTASWGPLLQAIKRKTGNKALIKMLDFIFTNICSCKVPEMFQICWYADRQIALVRKIVQNAQ